MELLGWAASGCRVQGQSPLLLQAECRKGSGHFKCLGEEKGSWKMDEDGIVLT